MSGALLEERYELGQLLGQGGMGVVYRAWDRRLERAVAVKLLLPDAGSCPAAPGAGEQSNELKALAALRHPHVVAVHDTGRTDDGQLYLVLELVPGCPLRTLLEREGSLPAPRALRLLAQAAQGLAEGHARGIVHGDVKPENMIVEQSADGQERLKLLDYGLARLAASGIAAAGAAALLPGGASAPGWGSPRYMSPERLAGAPPAPAADLYALGVTLYEALAGVAPFEDEDVISLGQAHRQREPVPLAVLCPGLTPGIAPLVHALLAKDAGGRPGSAAELARCLLALAEQKVAGEGEDRSGEPPALPLPAVSREGGWRALPLLLGALVVALAAALTVGLLLRSGAALQPSPAATTGQLAPGTGSPVADPARVGRGDEPGGPGAPPPAGAATAQGAAAPASSGRAGWVPATSAPAAGTPPGSAAAAPSPADLPAPATIAPQQGGRGRADTARPAALRPSAQRGLQR